MAAFDTTRPVAALSAGRISQFAVHAFGTMAAWNDARITRNQLSTLTARELDDIGLCYADIASVSTRPVS